MMHDILRIAILAGVSLAITVAIGQSRKKPNTFDLWWDSEGVVFFGVIFIVLFIVACGFGVFQVKVDY